MGEVIGFSDAKRRRDDEARRYARTRRPAPLPPATADHGDAELLWREAVGRELRRRRTELGRTLADVAETSGVSVPYLSEVERGRKEPSSEILAAIGGALGLGLVDLTSLVTETLRVTVTERPRGPVAMAGAGSYCMGLRLLA